MSKPSCICLTALESEEIKKVLLWMDKSFRTPFNNLGNNEKNLFNVSGDFTNHVSLNWRTLFRIRKKLEMETP